jgi:hypothetical protein
MGRESGKGLGWVGSHKYLDRISLLSGRSLAGDSRQSVLYLYCHPRRGVHHLPHSAVPLHGRLQAALTSSLFDTTSSSMSHPHTDVKASFKFQREAAKEGILAHFLASNQAYQRPRHSVLRFSGSILGCYRPRIMHRRPPSHSCILTAYPSTNRGAFPPYS